jgi:predicted transposase YdaD
VYRQRSEKNRFAAPLGRLGGAEGLRVAETPMTVKPYDPTLKTLVEIEPQSWPVLYGYAKAPTEVIDADIATVSGAADKVLRVAGDPAYLLHLEFVTGHDSGTLPSALLMRNGLLVRSGAVLLRPEADSPQLTGVYEQSFPDEEPYLTFRYAVVRVWQLPPEPLLTGGLALLPLAPISAVTEAELPGIIRRMEQRLSSRRAHKQAPLLWGAAYILLGLRYSPDLAAQLFRGVMSMKESSTYQAILEEGRQEGRSEGAVAEAKKALRIWGDDAFGVPDARTVAAIERINDLTQLDDLLRRVRSVTSWQQLLGSTVGGSRKGRRR